MGRGNVKVGKKSNTIKQKERVKPETVEPTVSEPNITVYDSTTCPKCKQLEDWLTKKGIEFQSKDAWDFKNELKNTSLSSLPIVKYKGLFYDFDGFIRVTQSQG